MNTHHNTSNGDRHTEDLMLHRRAEDALIAAGLVLPRSASESPRRPLSAAERAELAQRVHGRPLSKMIIEEREEREER